MKVYDLLVTWEVLHQHYRSADNLHHQNYLLSKKKPLASLNSWELSKRFSVKLLWYFLFFQTLFYKPSAGAFYWEGNNLTLYLNTQLWEVQGTERGKKERCYWRLKCSVACGPICSFFPWCPRNKTGSWGVLPSLLAIARWVSAQWLMAGTAVGAVPWGAPKGPPRILEGGGGTAGAVCCTLWRLPLIKCCFLWYRWFFFKLRLKPGV